MIYKKSVLVPVALEWAYMPLSSFIMSSCEKMGFMSLSDILGKLSFINGCQKLLPSTFIKRNIMALVNDSGPVTQVL